MSGRFLLRDLASTYGGLTGKTKADFGRGSATYVTFLEVVNNTRIQAGGSERVRVQPGERQNRVLRGDLLLNGSSETPEEVALAAVVDWDPGESTYLNSFCFGLRVHPDVPVDPAFLAYYFRSPAGRALVAPLAQGATRYNIAKTKLLGLEIDLPALRRQREIAQMLTDVDALTRSVKQAIAKKEAVATGLRQRLLTGETRLPGYCEGWDESTIGEVATIVSGGTPRRAVDQYWGGPIPWCTPTDITASQGRLLAETRDSITPAGLNDSAATLLPAGSTMLCTRATIGEAKMAAVPMATNQGFKSLIPRDGISADFLYFKVISLKGALVAKGAGSTFLEVTKKDVAALELQVPPFSEQVDIAAVLCAADEEISVLRRRLSKARAIKEGMMQELLTGPTSRPVEEHAA